MSFIGKILAFIGGGSASANSLYIVEGGRLAEGRGDKLSPRDQVQLLHQIARFAKQEEVRVQVVFEGRELREVSNGGEFNGVTVYFTEKAAAVADLMIKLARGGGRASVVITSDRTLESRAASMGFRTMRASTLKKAMEGGGSSNGGGGEGGGRGERFGRGQRQRRPQRQRFQQQSQQQQASPSQSQPAPSAQQPAPARAQEPGQPQDAAPAPEATAPAKPPAPENKVDPAVRNLIDLVE